LDVEQIKGFWDAIADEWEAKIGDEGDPFRRHLITPLIFDLLTGCAGNLILDVGCGNGYLIRLLAKQGYETYGLDLSQKQISNANKRNDGERLTQQNIETLNNRQLSANFPSAFDIIIVSMVLDGLGNINAALENCSELMNENGSLIITVPHPCFYALFRFPDETFNYLFENHDLLTMVNVTKPVIYYGPSGTSVSNHQM